MQVENRIFIYDRIHVLRVIGRDDFPLKSAFICQILRDLSICEFLCEDNGRIKPSLLGFHAGYIRSGLLPSANNTGHINPSLVLGVSARFILEMHCCCSSLVICSHDFELIIFLLLTACGENRLSFFSPRIVLYFNIDL